MNSGELFKIVGDRVKTIRTKELDLTQQAFADAIGFQRTKISDIERAEIGASLSFLAAIQRTFGYSIDWFVTGEGPKFAVDRAINLVEDPAPLYGNPTSLINSDSFKEIKTIRIPGVNSDDKAVQIQGEELDPHVRKSDILIFSKKPINDIKNNQIVLLRSNKTGYHIGQIYFSEARLSIELRQINPAYRSVQALEIAEITESYVAEYKVSRAILEPVVDVHTKLARIDERLSRMDSKL